DQEFDGPGGRQNRAAGHEPVPGGTICPLMRFERTLSRPAACEGIGLHSGRACRIGLLPAPPGTGRVFVRTDLGGAELAASLENLGKANYATCLVRGEVRVNTAEHLL